MDAVVPTDPAARARFVEAAQRAAGVIAARDRGDRTGAAQLLGEFANDTERMLAFYLIAELALKMVASTTGESIADAASALALDVDSVR
ncbi:MAG: superoxide dismutase [Desertimonas sp.]